MIWRWLYKTPWAILALTAAVLAGLNIFLSREAVDISPITMNGSEPAVADANAVPGDVVLPEGSRLSQTLARPLFSPTRREFTPEPKPVERAEAQPVTISENTQPLARPTIAFQGTRMIGQERRALVQLEGATAEWLPIGAQITGWTIADIGDNNLVLSQRDQSASYELFGSEEKEQGASNQLSAGSNP